MSSMDSRARDIIARQSYIHWATNLGASATFDDASAEGRQLLLSEADAILTALADAGIQLAGENEVVVDRGRLERLMVRAKMTPRNPETAAGILQDGDLDPADEPVAGEERQGRVRAIKRGELKLGNDVEAEMMADAGEVWEG